MPRKVLLLIGRCSIQAAYAKASNIKNPLHEAKIINVSARARRMTSGPDDNYLWTNATIETLLLLGLLGKTKYKRASSVIICAKFLKREVLEYVKSTFKSKGIMLIRTRNSHELYFEEKANV